VAKPCALALKEDGDKGAVDSWLSKESPKIVIIIGRLATETFERSASKLPYVIGALDVSPQERPTASGISLVVDPALMFAELKKLVPTLKRVFVAYEPEHDGWFIERAKTEARAFGLELQAEKAADLIQGGEQYGHFVQTAMPETDAIWLTLNNTIIDDSSVVPYVIEKGWFRRITIFSNKLAHAEWGVLFATYPDTTRLGRRLGDRALELAEHPERRLGIETLQDIKIAVNGRIARHLGVSSPSLKDAAIIYEQSGY
jgi:putative tryptophan/tyrosine transport system substrate-binding protein